MKDARRKTITLPALPRRIVSLVPSQTELLADLGLDEAVVGLTRFCVHPPDWKQRKAVVGGTKQVRLDRVRALEPDLILANREENTREDVEALEAVAPVFVTDVHDLAGALSMIRTVGQLTGRAEHAERLAGIIESDFDRLPPFPPLRAVYLIWNDPIMTVGRDTFIHAIMSRAGFENVFGTCTRYPEVTRQAIIDAAPDVLLLSSEPYPFKERHRAAWQALLPNTRTMLVDGELFSWYGSRLLHTPAYLTHLRQQIDNRSALT